MLMICCPWCGERSEVEFRCGHEEKDAHPEEWQNIADEPWADFLYAQTNPRGLIRERWLHAFGCGEWFTITRDTVTHEISGGVPSADRPEGRSV